MNYMIKLVLMFGTLLSTLIVTAANPVKLKSGDISVFKEKVVAHIVIDDHKTIIDGRNKPADVYYGEKGEYEKFVADLERGHQSFITYFNEKKGKIKMTMSDSANDAEYTLKVNVSSMNVGNAVGGAWGIGKTGGALINGTMELIENKTGKVVCEFEFSGVKGLLGSKFKTRVISVYRYLAAELLKVL